MPVPNTAEVVEVVWYLSPSAPEVPEVPLTPDEPEVPDDPLEPEEPDVPDEPELPEVPLVPDDPALMADTFFNSFVDESTTTTSYPDVVSGKVSITTLPDKVDDPVIFKDPDIDIS